MALAEEFNTESYRPPAGYALTAEGEHIIRAYVEQDKKNPSTLNDLVFDFLNRIVTVSPWGSSAATQVFTFKEFDEGSIEWHYQQLVKLGRKPHKPESLERKPDAAPPVHKFKP